MHYAGLKGTLISHLAQRFSHFRWTFFLQITSLQEWQDMRLRRGRETNVLDAATRLIRPTLKISATH